MNIIFSNPKSEARNPKQIFKNRLRVKVGMLVFFNHLTKRNQLLNPNPITIGLWILGFKYCLDFGN